MIVSEIGSAPGTDFNADADHITRQVFGDYAEAVTSRLNEKLEARRGQNRERLTSLDGQLEQVEKILAEIKDLAAAADKVSSGVAELQARYGETEPEKLIQPVKAPTPPKSAAPANAKAEAQKPAQKPETPKPEAKKPESQAPQSGKSN